jgi:DNA-binding transcriptional MerR regulator
MNLPLYEPDEQAAYTLEIVAEITGISSQTILHYQEEGLLPSNHLNDETVRTLRRIDHLQGELGCNESGLRLILNLMDEVERLREELRARR